MSQFEKQKVKTTEVSEKEAHHTILCQPKAKELKQIKNCKEFANHLAPCVIIKF